VKVTKEQIANTITSIVDKFDEENSIKFKPFIDSLKDNLKLIDSPEHLDIMMRFPFETCVGHIAKHMEGTNDDNIVFLYTHYSFVENHFRNLIETSEGSACCADKSRWIIKSLLKYYKDGTEFDMGIDEEKCFWKPRTIFREAKLIIDFYQALRHLYYGRFEKYVIILKQIMAGRTNVQ
jgi:hypothetical protein